MTAIELRIENDDQKKVVPSALYNNLSTVGGLRLFAYKKEAVVIKSTSVRLLSLDARTGKKRSTVTHVGASLIDGKLSATVTSGDTVELWDLAKELLISSTRVCGATGSSDVVAQCTAVGTNNGASFIVSGTSSGEVAFYSVNGELHTTPLARAGVHASGVTAVGTSPNPSTAVLAASGDANGTVVFWGRNMAPIASVPAREVGAGGDCVTGIAFDDKFIAVTYGGGKLRLYSTSTGTLAVEVAAHARWINAVAVCPSAHQAATCADDGMVLVWQLPTDSNPTMKLIGQKFMKNYLWTGVAFGEEGAGRLYAAAYDVDRTYTFSY